MFFGGVARQPCRLVSLAYLHEAGLLKSLLTNILNGFHPGSRHALDVGAWTFFTIIRSLLRNRCGHFTLFASSKLMVTLNQVK